MCVQIGKLIGAIDLLVLSQRKTLKFLYIQSATILFHSSKKNEMDGKKKC